MSIYEEVEIEDMKYDTATGIYSYPCPCGDRFVISLDELLDGDDVASCPSCTLRIRVIYDIDALPNPDDIGAGTAQVEGASVGAVVSAGNGDRTESSAAELLSCGVEVRGVAKEENRHDVDTKGLNFDALKIASDEDNSNDKDKSNNSNSNSNSNNDKIISNSNSNDNNGSNNSNSNSDS